MKKTKIQHYTIDQLSYCYEEISNRLIATQRKKLLTNTDFSIISNNCWGGHVYRRFGLPYTSPTIGLYFYAEEYIEFLKDLENNIHGDMQFINYHESKYCLYLKRKGQTDIPIGLINDKIEVVFLHYNNEKEAYEKWRRRSERVNMSNLIVKFGQMNKCTERHIKTFDRMVFRKKVLLLAKPVEGVNGIIVHRYAVDDEIKDDTTFYARHINLIDLINS